MEEPSSWIGAAETAAAMLARAQRERPFLLLPPPLHRAPLRVGNVVEIAGPSPSAKSHLLLQAAVHCILPKEWNGVRFGGLERMVTYFDLDCRFDVLRLAQVLKYRIAAGFLELNNKTCQGSNTCSQKFDAFNAEYCPVDNELFLACMRRFLYIQCYSSLEFLAALKTMLHQSRKESETCSGGIHFVMIDSIGAFYWIDRAYKLSPLGEIQRKSPSLQSLTETIVDEMHKLLQVLPVLVLATKATIFGAGTLQSDAQRHVSKQWPLEDMTNASASSKELSEKFLYREHMPSVWQSFVTHRIHLQPSDGIVANGEHGSLPVYTAKWFQPSINLLDKFSVRDLLWLPLPPCSARGEVVPTEN